MATDSAETVTHWPSSLKNYVNRCFRACISEEQKDKLDSFLRDYITAAATSDTLWTIEWEKEEVPACLGGETVSGRRLIHGKALCQGR